MNHEGPLRDCHKEHEGLLHVVTFAPAVNAAEVTFVVTRM